MNRIVVVGPFHILLQVKPNLISHFATVITQAPTPVTISTVLIGFYMW